MVTNDGDLAEKLAHPRHQIYRTYHVQVAGNPKKEVYESLKEGLRFAEGRFRVRSVKSFKKVGQSTWLEVVLSEGHNRELRRLFARVGHKVLKLTRISFGPIRLGKLKMGEFRPLSLQELEALHGILANPRRREGPSRPREGGGRPTRPASGAPRRERREGEGERRSSGRSERPERKPSSGGTGFRTKPAKKDSGRPRTKKPRGR